MAVLEPIKVNIINHKSDEVFETPIYPKNPEAGNRKVTLERTIYIDKKDFHEVDDSDFFGLAPNKEVGLKYCGLITCVKVYKNDKDEVIELDCTYSSEVKKTKGRLHWIGHRESVRVTVNIYDYLFKSDIIPDDDFLKDINPNSLIIRDKALVHSSVANGSIVILSHYQFERHGFFVVDKDTNVNAHRYVFNLSVV